MLGEENVHERPPIMGGEDFGRYGREGVPIFLYFLGTVRPKRVEAPSSRRQSRCRRCTPTCSIPVPEPTIRTGVLTMSMAVLNLLGKK